MTLFGIDVSHHQPGIDLRDVAVDFVFAKATEGATFKDERFPIYQAQAEDANLLFAAYHFLRGDSDPGAQARNVREVLGDSRIPVVIDIERTSGMPQPDMSHVRGFTNAAEGLGLRVADILYLPEWYWAEIRRPDTNGWKIWQSDYGSNNGIYPGDTSPRWVTMGRQAAILQFSSNGLVQGYAGRVDVNAFRGTREELAQTGWFIDYKEQFMATKADIQAWVATTPIVVDAEGTVQPLQKVLRQILNKPVASGGATAEEIAAKVVASLPPDEELTRLDVKKALAEVLLGGASAV